MNSFINTGSYDTDDFAYSVACLNRHSLEEQFHVRIKTGFLLLQYKEYKRNLLRDDKNYKGRKS